MTKRVGKTTRPQGGDDALRRADGVEAGELGSVDRVYPRLYSRKSMEGNDVLWRSSTIAKCWNELSGYRTR